MTGWPAGYVLGGDKDMSAIGSVFCAIWLTSAARGQEPAPPAPAPPPAAPAPPPAAPADELPLAIPVDAPPPAPLDAPPAPDGPRRGERIEAARTYRGEALTVRDFTETYVSSTYAYAYRRRFWGGYGRWGVFAVPVVVHRDAWGVFQGNARLDVPSTYAALGDDDGKRLIERKIRTNEAFGTAGYVVGAAGVAATIVGYVGRDNATTVPQLVTWSNVAVGGLVALVGGLVEGSITSGRAERLQYDHDATFDRAELDQRIADHNAALADQLGLTPQQVARIELGPEPPPRR